MDGWMVFLGKSVDLESGCWVPLGSLTFGEERLASTFGRSGSVSCWRWPCMVAIVGLGLSWLILLDIARNFRRPLWPCPANNYRFSYFLRMAPLWEFRMPSSACRAFVQQRLKERCSMGDKLSNAMSGCGHKAVALVVKAPVTRNQKQSKKPDPVCCFQEPEAWR